MRELILEILQEYAIWGTVIVMLMAVLILTRMQRQLKKLNRNLAMITKNIQDYFEVIMEEEVTKEPDRETARTGRREDVYLTREEREMLLSRPKEERAEDEAVFNAVLNEYFP